MKLTDALKIKQGMAWVIMASVLIFLVFSTAISQPHPTGNPEFTNSVSLPCSQKLPTSPTNCSQTLATLISTALSPQSLSPSLILSLFFTFFVVVITTEGSSIFKPPR